MRVLTLWGRVENETPPNSTPTACLSETSQGLLMRTASLFAQGLECGIEAHCELGQRDSDP
jgi:hypothetical protein